MMAPSSIRNGSLIVFAVLLVHLLTFGAPPTLAQTACPGSGTTIAANTTWSADCTLSGDTTIASGATLTITAGVDVLMTGAFANLFVNGRLNAQGTDASRISFTRATVPPAPGNWGRIAFNATSANSVLDFVTLQQGGGGGFPSLESRSSSVRVSNTTVRDGAGDSRGLQKE